jgi:hypothetical protein
MSMDDAAEEEDPVNVRTRQTSRRWILALVVLVVVIGAVAGLRWYRQHPRPRWKNADAVWVAVSPNRKTIGVWYLGYYSPSCSQVRAKVRRQGTRWIAEVQYEQIREFCTTEMGLGPASFWATDPVAPSQMTIPDGAQSQVGIEVIQLDTPVPEDVTVSIE